MVPDAGLRLARRRGGRRHRGRWLLAALHDGGPVRLSVMIEDECTLTATFGPLDLTCVAFVLQIAHHVLTLMRRFLAFFSADSLMRHPVLDLCK